MEQIHINLLPQEFTLEKSKRVRFLKIQVLGVAILLFFVFLSSLTVALRILQSRNINLIQSQLGIIEQRITEDQGKQASLLIVKDRLTTINQYLEIPSSQATIYRLIIGLLPPGVAVSSMTVDKGGAISLSAAIADVETLGEMITALLSPEQNEDKIVNVEIENLSRGRDGIFRIGLNVKSNLK